MNFRYNDSWQYFIIARLESESSVIRGLNSVILCMIYLNCGYEYNSRACTRIYSDLKYGSRNL